MTVKVYYDRDSDMNLIRGKTVAIIGYGSQGHAQAQNLRDSGCEVVVAQRPGSKNYRLAQKHGFQPTSTEEASEIADIVQLLIPDEIQKEVYYGQIEKYMTGGKALVFSHGFNIHFGQIKAPDNVDVYMVAPKGPGHLVRRIYLEGGGVPALVAVGQDATGCARQLALAHACGIGAGRAGIIETTFKEETETDLFGEQVVLCGGLTELIRSGFDTLVEAGYQPEIAYFECLHEVKLIVDLIYENGIANMRSSISDTAEYGDLTRGKRIITEETRKEMERILREIQTGQFVKEWLLENIVGRPEYNSRKRSQENHLIEVTGRKLRKMMKWLSK